MGKALISYSSISIFNSFFILISTPSKFNNTHYFIASVNFQLIPLLKKGESRPAFVACCCWLLLTLCSSLAELPIHQTSRLFIPSSPVLITFSSPKLSDIFFLQASICNSLSVEYIKHPSALERAHSTRRNARLSPTEKMPVTWDVAADRKLLICCIEPASKPNWERVSNEMGAEYTPEACR